MGAQQGIQTYSCPHCRQDHKLDPANYGGTKGVFHCQCGHHFTPYPAYIPTTPQEIAEAAEKKAMENRQ